MVLRNAFEEMATESTLGQVLAQLDDATADTVLSVLKAVLGEVQGTLSVDTGLTTQTDALTDVQLRASDVSVADANARQSLATLVTALANPATEATLESLRADVANGVDVADAGVLAKVEEVRLLLAGTLDVDTDVSGLATEATLQSVLGQLDDATTDTVLSTLKALAYREFNIEARNSNTDVLYKSGSTTPTATAAQSGSLVVDNAFPASEVGTNIDTIVETVPSSIAPDSEPDASWIVVPAATTGRVDGKKVRSGPIPVDASITVDHHLQLNNATYGTPPNGEDVVPKQRLTADLGFVAFRLVNARSEGINGLTAQETLADVDGLVASAIDRSVATSAQGGEDGWADTMVAWDSALPGGDWNHTVDVTAPAEATGLEANPTEPYTLLAINPNLIVIGAGGHDTAGEDGLHWTAGSDLLIGAVIFDIGQRLTVPADDSDVLDPGGQPYPRAYMTVARFNNQIGAAQFYDSDGTWKNVEDNIGSVYQWQLMSILRSNQLAGVGSVGDAQTYVHKFPEADTANWGLSDLFFVPIVYVNGTPYSLWGQTGVTGGSNQHKGYAVDSMALGLHGVLGTR